MSSRHRSPSSEEQRSDSAASHVSPLERRRAVLFALLGVAGLAAGCGGSDAADDSSAAPPTGSAPPPAPAPAPSPAPAPAPDAWSVGPIYFAVGSGATLDLATTLPNGVARGGSFGVSSSGASLPAGMSLSPSGILSVGSATEGAIVGVVFTYDVPTS